MVEESSGGTSYLGVSGGLCQNALSDLHQTLVQNGQRLAYLSFFHLSRPCFNLLGSAGNIIPFRGSTIRAYSDSYTAPKVACFCCTEGREYRRIEHVIPPGLNHQPTCSVSTRSSTFFIFSRIGAGAIES